MQTDTLFQVLLLVLVIVSLVLILSIRRRARRDRIEQLFDEAGLPLSKAKLKQIHDEFSRLVTEEGQHRLKSVLRLQTEVDAIHREVERVREYRRTIPQVVKDIGKTLQEVEKEYLHNLSMLKSEQAREALRLSTEKEISEILVSAGASPSPLPEFRIQDK